MEKNLQAAVERSVPESERKPDHRDPTEYQEQLTSRIRELVNPVY